MIKFDKNNHVYTLDGVELASVGSVVKRFVPEFAPSEKVISDCIRKGGFDSEQQLRDSWEEKAAAARILGSRVHRMVEQIILSEPVSDPVPEFQESAAAAAAFVLSNYRVLSVEKIVYSAALMTAGTADLICKDDDGYIVLDIKTGSFDESNRWRKMLPPFERYDDCHLHRYSLQVGLYAMLLGKEPVRSGILHLTPERFRPVPSSEIAKTEHLRRLLFPSSRESEGE